MAAGPLGVNLARTLGFVDLIREAGAWQSDSSAALPLDTNGWPEADAKILIFDERVNQFFNGPDPNAIPVNIGGTYHLSFNGQAVVLPDFPQNFQVENQVYNTATNTTTADLVVPQNALQLLILNFENTVNPASSTGAGVTNVKLIQPGYSADTTQLFTNNMLNDLSPFGTIRFVNTDSANNYPATYDSNNQLVPLEWSQRKLPSTALQLSGAGATGESWEYMIALANATNENMWINIPGPASDDYVKQLANLIKNGDTVGGVTYAGLNPNLKVYVEYSNEVWGGIQTPTTYNNDAAAQQVASGHSDLNNDGSTDPSVWAQRYYLERTEQVTNLFRGVFGADPTYSRVRPVLGWQEGNTSYYTSTFPWFEKNYGAPSQYFYGMGNANYVNATDFSSVDNFFTSLYASLNQETAVTSQFSTVAAYYGLQNVAYEGGLGSSAGNTTQGQVALAANRDPRMEAFIKQLYTDWYAAGGSLANLYDGPYDIYTPYYQYSLMETGQAGDPTSAPKFRGVQDLQQASSQAVTAGNLVSATGTTGLSVNTDSLGQSFASPAAGQTNYWLLNVSTAGVYNLTLQTQQSSAGSGQVAVSLSDKQNLGTYTLGSGGTYSLGQLTLHAGLNTLALTTLSGFSPLNLSLTPTTASKMMGGLQDTGFQSVPVGKGTNGFVYNLMGSPWMFSGMSGVAAIGSPLTTGVPATSSGQQVAFLQGQGIISQAFNNNVQGVYHLAFSIAQRVATGAEKIQVLLDGQQIGSFTTNSTSFQKVTTSKFMLSPGTHLLTFKGLSTSTTATALLDGITQVLDQASAVPRLSDAGFETVKQVAGLSPDVVGSAWTFTGQAGVATLGSLTNMKTIGTQGSQVGYIKNQGSMSQSVAGFAAGTYHIGFLAANRVYPTSKIQKLQVLVDNQVVGTFTPGSGVFQSMRTADFALTAGTHTIGFRGLNSTGDATAMIDNVKVLAKKMVVSTPLVHAAALHPTQQHSKKSGHGHHRS